MVLNVLIKSRQKIKNKQFEKLILVMRDDPEINQKISQLLKLDSYRRRIVLNRWVEKLRRSDASLILIQALSYLFDDEVARKILIMIDD